MAGLIENLMAMWWFNRKDRFVANRERQKTDREFERWLARGGYVSSDIQARVSALYLHDELAMIDRVVGTLDRDSPEWQTTYTDLRRGTVRYIDGYKYDVHDFFKNEYCMKIYGKKNPSLEVLLSFRG